MSIEADFTPPGVAHGTATASQTASFPLGTNLNIVFSMYEDRLVLRCRRVNRDPVNVLLTRRMTLIVLAQLLAHLPELSGLDKTPTQYWQEVLQMAHQEALESGRGPQTGAAAETGQPASAPQAEASPPAAAKKKPSKLEGDIYLATSLTIRKEEERLILAMTGLPMPRAMTEPCERAPLFAMPLDVKNVHQLIQLLIDKARDANWNLPVNLPWLESPSDAPATTLGPLH